MTNYRSLVATFIVNNSGRFARPVLALLSAHMITVGGEFESFAELYQLPGYSLAMGSSLIISILSIEMVHQLNKRMTYWDPTVGLTNTKLYMQALCGVALPFSAIFIMAAFYYGMNDIHILSTMWLDNNGLIVVLLLLILNSFYIINQFMVRKPRELMVVPEEIANENWVVYVSCHGRAKIIYFRDGGQIVDYRSFERILATLDSHEYYFSPRTCIIRRDNVILAFKEGKKFKVRLKVPENVDALFSGSQVVALSSHFNKKV